MSITQEAFDALVAEVAAIKADANITKAEENTFYLLVCGVFVFLMQAGFALLAAGSIR